MLYFHSGLAVVGGDSEEAPASREATARRRTAKPAHVLIVDDEWLIRWSLRERFSGAGYRVSEAADGAAALAPRPGGDPPDLVLLDLRLPDTDGLALLRELRGPWPRCRYILMTAYGTPEIVQAALELGAHGVVSKPFNVDDLLKLAAEALDST